MQIGLSSSRILIDLTVEKLLLNKPKSLAEPPAFVDEDGLPLAELDPPDEEELPEPDVDPLDGLEEPDDDPPDEVELPDFEELPDPVLLPDEALPEPDPLVLPEDPVLIEVELPAPELGFVPLLLDAPPVKLLPDVFPWVDVELPAFVPPDVDPPD